jgi:predicted DNA-binding antitoxin AbrB/MazE fold protein
MSNQSTGQNRWRAGTRPPKSGPKRQRGIGEASETTAQLVSQAVGAEVTCADPFKKENKPTPTPARRAEQVSDGTAARRAEQVSDEQLTGDQTTATRSPAVSCSTHQLLNPAAAPRPEHVTGDRTTEARSSAVHCSTVQLLISPSPRRGDRAGERWSGCTMHAGRCLVFGGIGVRVIDAIYQNGMFRPMSPLRLPEGTKVRIELDPPAAHPRPSLRSMRDDHRLRQPAHSAAKRHDRPKP